MTVTLTRKGLAIAVVVGLVTVGAASTVSYAAGTSTTGVTACANSKGRLALTNGKNKCAKGYKKVTIAKQGPRGATGKAGATGKTGATGKQGVRGPGIQTYRLATIFATQGSKLVVGGYTYSSTCEVTDNGGLQVRTTFTVTAPSGQNVSLEGISFGGSDNSPVAAVVDTSSNASTSVSVFANGGQASTVRAPSLQVVGNDSDALVTLKLRANPSAGSQFNPLPIRCSVEAVITPAA